jgi:hypothetical protein
VRNRAIALRNRPEFAREKLTELGEKDFDTWVKKESHDLARKVAYQGGELKGSPDKEEAPVLPDGYTKKAKAVAERRIVLAGYRLAELLKKAVGVS